jgi:long-chain acyl-CoA synthetase
VLGAIVAEWLAASNGLGYLVLSGSFNFNTARSFAAIISVGAVNVSMNSWWTEDEMDFALVDSGATVLICDQQRYDIGAESCVKHGVKVLVARPEKPLPANIDQWEAVVKPGAPHPGADIDPDDDATILYTSGTTGRPKGAVSTHRAIISALMSFSARNGVLTMSGTKLKDVVGPEVPTSFILIVPLFHVTGCVPVMMSCFIAGLKLAIMYKWDAEKALEMIEREQITNFVGVPTQSWDLVNSPAFDKYDTTSQIHNTGEDRPATAFLQLRCTEERIHCSENEPDA